MQKAEMIAQGDDQSAIGNFHQVIVPSVLVADFFQDSWIFGPITGGIERAGKHVGFRMAEVIELYVQAGIFQPEVIGTEMPERPAIAGKIAGTLQHFKYGAVDMVAARVRFQGQPDRDPPFLGLNKRIGQRFIAEIIGCQENLAAGRHGGDMGMEQIAQGSGGTVGPTQKDAEMRIAWRRCRYGHKEISVVGIGYLPVRFQPVFLPENRVRFPRTLYHVIKKVYIIVLFPGLLEDE
jgi:hypothetical protein